MAVEEVGARLVVTGASQAGAALDAILKKYQALNKEIIRTTELSRAQADASVKANAATADSAKAAAGAQADLTAATKSHAALGVAAGAGATQLRRAASVHENATARIKKSLASLAPTANKITKWGLLGSLGLAYESIKQYSSFQQQVNQLAIDAGINQKDLPYFNQKALDIAKQTGVAFNAAAQGLYRIASANAGLGKSKEYLASMALSAAQLVQMSGGTATMDQVSRIYGSIAASGVHLSHTKNRAPTGSEINAWANATVGAGDIRLGDLLSALGTGTVIQGAAYGLTMNDIGAAIALMSPGMSAQKVGTLIGHASSLIQGSTTQSATVFGLLGLNTAGPNSVPAYMKKYGFVPTVQMLSNRLLHGGLHPENFHSKSYGNGAAGMLSQLEAWGVPKNVAATAIANPNAPISFTPGQAGYSSSKALQSGAGITGVQGLAQLLLTRAFGGAKQQLPLVDWLFHPEQLLSKYNFIEQNSNQPHYQKALALALGQPAVQIQILFQKLKALGIMIGGTLTPIFITFLRGLNSFGDYLKQHKVLFDSMIAAIGALFGTSLLISFASKIAKFADFLKGLGKLFGGGGSGGGVLRTVASGGGVGLNEAALALDRSAAALTAAAEALRLGGAAGGIPGVLRGGGTAAAGAEGAAARMGLGEATGGALLATSPILVPAAAAVFAAYNSKDPATRRATRHIVNIATNAIIHPATTGKDIASTAATNLRNTFHHTDVNAAYRALVTHDIYGKESHLPFKFSGYHNGKWYMQGIEYHPSAITAVGQKAPSFKPSPTQSKAFNAEWTKMLGDYERTHGQTDAKTSAAAEHLNKAAANVDRATAGLADALSPQSTFNKTVQGLRDKAARSRGSGG